MNLDTYNINANKACEIFEFQSIGIKGKISKVVKFIPTSFEGIYNLGFGDFNPKTGQIDDKIVSNNGDSEIVLSTVVLAIDIFFEKHPNAQVYLTGSTKSRTRLYRIAINKYFVLFSKKYEILGELDESFERFIQNTKYQGYLIRLKI
jgi:hypothetical protein